MLQICLPVVYLSAVTPSPLQSCFTIYTCVYVRFFEYLKAKFRGLSYMDAAFLGC